MSANEVNKSVFIGNTGHTAEVTEEDRDTTTEEAKHVKKLVARAGKMLCPMGSEYLGSGAVHYYSKAGVSGPQYFIACQTDINKVVEGHADMGWKQLKSAFMKAYGRTEPKVRS
jgi:hypothetical protein